MQIFKLDALPHHGRHLIEASAGTGKTHNLMALALRALGEQQVAPADLVLMTFTRASTRELRARLRDALTQAIEQPATAEHRQRYIAAQQQLHRVTIVTIHGFALQVLQSLGPSVDIHPRPMNESVDAVLLDAALDTYRQLGSLDRSGLFKDTLGSQKSFAQAAAVLSNQYAVWVPTGEEAPDLTATFAEFQGRLTELSKSQDELLAQPKTQKPTLRGYIDACLSATHPGDVPKTAVDYFAKKWKETEQPIWQRWHAITRPTPAQEAFRAYAFRQVDALLSQRLAERGEMHPDQILSEAAGVATAVDPELKPTHRVILVDEFQDTDRAQWTLLDALYPDTEDRLMVLVGDPKQAIYRFRGADTRFYYQVRASLPDTHCWQLDTNWRSTESVVNGLNQLYDPAFAVGQSLECIPLKTGRLDRPPLMLDGKALPAFQWCSELTADAVAQLTAALSGLGAESRLCLGSDPVCPGDITVLVNNWQQASDIQAAGRTLGVEFHFADQKSVFNHPLSREMVSVLYALANPDDLNLLSGAAATELIGVSLVGDGPLLAHADFQDWQQRVIEARDRWYREGPSRAIQELLAEYETTARQPQTLDGVRNVMALNQCLEVFGAEAKGLSPLEAALWWGHRATDAVKAAEADKPRAPSLRGVATITTVHGAKGLQYPIVILAGRIPIKTPKAEAFCHSHSSPDGLVLNFTDQALEPAAADGVEDALRLTYVALTRAKHAVFLASQGKESAITPLLDGRDPESIGSDHALADWVSSTSHKRAGFTPRMDDSVPLQRDAQPKWFVRSFSSLTRHAHTHDEPTRAEDEIEITPDEMDYDNSWHGIPGGTDTGNFVHQILEHRARRHLNDVSLASLISLQWPRHLSRAIEPAMVHWIETIERQPLPGGSALAELPARQLRPEPQFQLAFKSGLTQADLIHAFEALPWWQDSLTMPAIPLQGQLTGFIDLVYERNGRYYVLDYKTNRLGDRGSHYHAEALRDAMTSSHYYLQAAMYSVALHRWLTQRLPDYEPERHLGDVVYLFCRGLDGPTAGIWSAPMNPEAITEIARRCFDAPHD